ncbi:MAG: ATP-dependent zinc metalloprotease FtsH [Lachnospiraceae bacterium]|nr:ATP-dependent zinc metalloprotease FtsH [Lachnospiraceae bacterium]
MNRNTRSGFGFYFLIMIAVCALLYMTQRMQMTNTVSYSESEFVSDLEMNQVADVTISQNEEVPTGSVQVTLESGGTREFYTTDVNKVLTAIEEKAPDLSPTVLDVTKPSWILSVLPYVVMAFLVVFLMMFFMNQNGGGNSKVMNFGKSRAKMHIDGKTKVTFQNVAGLDEEKEELREIVDFLKSPGKFIEVGARIPKGVLLVGPPGTGKTLLAKAVAGEAGVPFFSISGSDFVEMFVGVGASRVRDLFEEGKKNAPCIIFIDEIDAVARRRGTGLGGGHDEREQTLNQLLVEMDGFGVNEGIIVVAATNRVDILDPAILRPGRFDRKVMVGRPDVKGREEILNVHVKGKPLAEDVDLSQIARTTAGFSGADLENLMNESAIYAARGDRKFIKKEDIDKAFIKVGIGTEKKSRLVPEKERRITAYHEAGHAILFHVMPDMESVYTISIIPTGVGAAGYTMPLPENDNVFMTKGKMLQEIKVDLAGRVAEELIFDDITTGASQDIKVATKTARAMVTEYGMSEKVGLINYGEENGDEVFLGRDLGHARSYGEDVATVIDQEVKRIIDECYQETHRILTENMPVLHRCANLLLEKERIDRDEFEALFVETNEEAKLSENEA